MIDFPGAGGRKIPLIFSGWSLAIPEHLPAVADLKTGAHRIRKPISYGSASLGGGHRGAAAAVLTGASGRLCAQSDREREDPWRPGGYELSYRELLGFHSGDSPALTGPPRRRAGRGVSVFEIIAPQKDAEAGRLSVEGPYGFEKFAEGSEISCHSSPRGGGLFSGENSGRSGA